MSLMKILKMLTGGIGSTTKTFTNTMKVIDNVLEKEYITGSVDKAKEFTGDVVQKAGEVFEKGKMKVEELRENGSLLPFGEVIKGYKEKAIRISDRIEAKIDDISDDIIDDVNDMFEDAKYEEE